MASVSTVQFVGKVRDDEIVSAVTSATTRVSPGEGAAVGETEIVVPVDVAMGPWEMDMPDAVDVGRGLGVGPAALFVSPARAAKSA